MEDSSLHIAIVPAIVLAIITVLWLIVKVKYRFWSSQPVFHAYDVWYHLRPPGIIRTAVPEKTRYFDPAIRFSEMPDTGTEVTTAFCAFIRKSYLQNGANRYAPSEAHIMPYFDGHSTKCHLGALFMPDTLVNTKTHGVVKREKMVACMTSRPMACSLVCPDGATRDAFTCNYVDYLCVAAEERGKGRASNAIYTHEYHNRRTRTRTGGSPPVVSVFKREGEITAGVVPICKYSMDCFDMRGWVAAPPLPANMGNVVRCTPAMLHVATDFLRRSRDAFDLYLGVGVGNLAALLRTENVYLYLHMASAGTGAGTGAKVDVVGAYFFRHTCTWIREGAQVLTCFASVFGANANATANAAAAFAHAFKVAVTSIVSDKKHQYAYLLMENISHNDVLISNLEKRTPVCMREPAAYFFYNFAYRSFQSNRCIVIN